MTRLHPGCFGKLPLFADFVRHGPPVPELGELDQWLQEGIAAARQGLATSWEQTFESAPPGRFLYYSRSTGRVLGGVYLPSRDKAGRRFPFLIHAALEVRPLKVEPSLWPLLWEEFLGRAERLAAAHAGSADLRSYLGRMEEAAVEADPAEARRRFQEFLARETNRSFWTALLGAPLESSAAARYGLLQNLADTVGAGAIPRYALRFPLAGGEAGLAFWLEACARMERRLGPPSLAAWNGPGATVVFDQLLPKYFLPVFRPDRPSAQLFPLLPSGPLPPPRQETARRRFDPALQDPALPLAQLLQRLGP